MTTQSQVEEQVIAEWLSLAGYFIETNIRLSGNREADIVAVKIEGRQVIVRHVEVGGLASSYRNHLTEVQGKFQKKSEIKEFVTERISLPAEFVWDYRCEYVFTHLAKTQIQKLTEALAKDDIKLVSFETILLEKIPLTMKEWREKESKSSRRRGKDQTYIQIPRRYRILYIVDRLFELNSSLVDE